MTPALSTLPMKDSGMEWVGTIPLHWDVRPFYSFAAEVVSPNTGLKERNLLSLSYGQLVRKDMDRLEGLTPASFEGYNIIEANDIVFRLTDLQNDQRSLRSARALERGIITSAYVAVRPRTCPRFFEYLMRSYDTSKVFYGIGGGIRQSMKFADLKRLPVVVPPTSEMEAIASYLDRATARIDTLVAKKTRFIELLREKRQSLITHAVTKGLDPNVEMKDSGVEWLGEVPNHWNVVQSRRLFSERNEKARGDDQQLTVSQKHGLLRQSEFMEREGRRVVVVQKGHDILKRALRGDFVISMRSFQGGLELSGYEGSVSSAYVPITPTKWVVPTYFRWVFKSITYIQALQATSDLVRDGQALRFENFAKVPLPHVPESEQVAIASFLDRATSRIDTLIAKTERSIELLREHRTALITAAVTGKLDLRPAT
jgi:type I restriction enzyme S subunit